jgi:hypothetical protein
MIQRSFPTEASSVDQEEEKVIQNLGKRSRADADVEATTEVEATASVCHATTNIPNSGSRKWG